jgi:acetylornithine deacetylase/succinyl-diaminopimelate desuccinylase-like protein
VNLVRTTEAARLAYNPVELLQRLIRFKTTNPPGNEAEGINYLAGLLAEAGIPTTVLGRSPERPNLIARLEGQGQSPPVLLYGHMDVVTTSGQNWQHPPFDGEIIDDYIWGRGALDMKGGLAMMVSALLRARLEELPIAGDVLLAVVSDEEDGGDKGSRFLVEKHADHFEGVRYALGEFGAFSIRFGSQRFYPIMVAEKQICAMKAIVRGPGGHGSMPLRGGAMSKLSWLLYRLEKHRLPVHITPVVQRMFEMVAAHQTGPGEMAFQLLLNPVLTDRLLGMFGELTRAFDPLLHNTVTPTIVQGGEKINVIPSEIELALDGRLLPGFKPEDMIAELTPITGKQVELEVVRYDPGPPEPDWGQFDVLADILREADPEGIPIPLLLSGVTDGRFFARLGIQTYGFLPMRLPPDFNFAATIHAADERIPVAALEFGTQAILKALQRIGQG